jgi:hypothetical protein
MRIRHTLVGAVTWMLFGVGLCALGVMAALEHTLGGAHLTHRRR